jgi:uncharacterized BrkB/YihY/UPF0761 family membrane protein
VGDHTSRATVGRWITSARAEGDRLAHRLPVVRRMLDSLLRVGLVDRAVVIAAQALFALLPLVVILVVVLPGDATREAVRRFAGATGFSPAGSDAAVSQLYPPSAVSGAETQVGVVSAIVIIVSASSFARALMRTYERVWDLPPVGGLAGRRTALTWLLGWLALLVGVGAIGWRIGRLDGWIGSAVSGSVRALILVALLSAIWWWTLHMLLSGRVSWSRLWLPAVASGAVVLGYVTASRLVMPARVASSVHRFGTFGLTLALASWLIGLAGGLVLAAIAGRGLAEELPALRRRGRPGHRGRGQSSGSSSNSAGW